jgi:H/ACA ribonucleoprotein complex subunit 4
MKIDIEKIKKEKTTEKLLEFGLINIDKPSGPTSFWTSQFVKKSLKLKKTGHLGTLDPQVSGVLPVALGRACKLNEYFMHRDKVYVGVMRVHKDGISDDVLKKEMSKFTGVIKQLPPKKSRVKRAVREREVKKFEILERDGKDVLFISDVQAGTYIRKLNSDLGEKIGGAHMLELRRTKAGMFTETGIVDMYEFEKAVEEYKSGDDKKLRGMITPGEVVGNLLECVEVKEDVLSGLLNGKPLFREDAVGGLGKEEKFVVFSGERFVGVYRRVDDGDIIGKAEFVFN